LDTANIRLSTDESTTMAETQKTTRPQKSSAKAKAAVNKMKEAATTVPCPPNESDASDKAKVEVENETVVWDHLEAEQKNKADEMYVDDGAVKGIQSIMEAAAVVASLSGVATTITAAPDNGPKKSKAKKLVHPRGKRRPLKRRNLAPQVMIRYVGYVFLNSAGARLIMAQ
jgi:hypothetical protein